MTKEEAKKMLTNTKVYVNGKSKEIQEKLFKIGFSWRGYQENYIMNLNDPFLFIEESITCGWTMCSFNNCSHKEVSAEDILNIKLDEEFVPQKGDIIFVTDTNDNDWITIFNKIENGIIYAYADFDIDGNRFYGNNSEKNKFGNMSKTKNIRLATKEEKEKLLFALKKQCLFWNEETKQVESIKKEHEFKPFDKVLGRDSKEDEWNLDLFGNFSTEKNTYSCVGGYWKICIPYEGNEKLLGTSNSPK